MFFAKKVIDNGNCTWLLTMPRFCVWLLQLKINATFCLDMFSYCCLYSLAYSLGLLGHDPAGGLGGSGSRAQTWVRVLANATTQMNGRIFQYF